MRLSKGWGCGSVVESLACLLLALDSISNAGSKIGLLGFHTYLLEFLHFVDISPLLSILSQLLFAIFSV